MTFGCRPPTFLGAAKQVMEIDLCDFVSVRDFARAFKAKHGDRLDALVNNGGCARWKMCKASSESCALLLTYNPV